MKLMPQEIEVWYLIPAIRRELARCFTQDYKMNQKEASDVLGITESAISQYLKDKRGGELKFNKSEIGKIKKVAGNIVNDKINAGKHLFELSLELRGTDSLCELHKKHDPSVERDCKLCMS